MKAGLAQDPKKSRRLQRRRGTARIWIRGTLLEQRAVRFVGAVEGLGQGDLLRRYSLNDIVAKYRQRTAA